MRRQKSRKSEVFLRASIASRRVYLGPEEELRGKRSWQEVIAGEQGFEKS